MKRRERLRCHASRTTTAIIRRRLAAYSSATKKPGGEVVPQKAISISTGAFCICRRIARIILWSTSFVTCVSSIIQKSSGNWWNRPYPNMPRYAKSCEGYRYSLTNVYLLPNSKLNDMVVAAVLPQLQMGGFPWQNQNVVAARRSSMTMLVRKSANGESCWGSPSSSLPK